MDAEASGLQSGFVLGIVIASMLLAHRLGGTTILALRFAQLTLALVLTMLVFSATTTVDGLLGIQFEVSDNMFETGGPDPGLVGHNSVVDTVHMALATLLVAGGAAILRRWGAIAPGFLLAGVLLMLFAGSPADPVGGVYQMIGLLLPRELADAGDARNIARVLVLLVGALLLVWTIYREWERDNGDDAEEAV